jgi:archaellum component FlaF (FlaF/FlaG flagellin family)
MIGKRGVSEIAAAMLLITIAVAASIIIYVYSSGLMGSLQGAQPQQGQYTNQITLEYYDWTANASGTYDSSLHTLKVTLRNTGSGLAVFAAFYVSGQAVALKSGSTCTIFNATSTVTLQPQSSCVAILGIPSGFTISAGFAYAVRIVTRDGGVFSYSCIAGRSTGSFS